MSNSIRFDVISSRGLAHALALAFYNAPSGEATHYKVETIEGVEVRDVPRLILGWGDRPINGGFMLPYRLRMDNNSAVEFVNHWLEAATYPVEDQLFDGSTEKGWRIYNENNGRIGQYTYSFCAIEPILLYYVK